MGGFVAEAESLFGTSDLYSLLGLQKTSRITPAQVKKAYYKASMKCHPDRFSHESPDSREMATRKFQLISRAYAILGDAERKAVYDDTGVVDEEDDVEEGHVDWTAKWRLLFKKVTLADIDAFCTTYKGSEEEREDVKQAYIKCRGDMGKILEMVLATTMDDEPRIAEIIRQLIHEGSVESYKAFTEDNTKKATARRKRAAREAKEAETMLADLKKREGTADLTALIAHRQKDRQHEMDSFLEQLEKKYAQPAKKRSRKQ